VSLLVNPRGVVTHLQRQSWNRVTVTDFIVSCREQGGVPMFRTRFAGLPYETPEGKEAAVAVCWGGVGPEISTAFTELPRDVVETLSRRRTQWDWLLALYGGELI